MSGPQQPPGTSGRAAAGGPAATTRLLVCAAVGLVIGVVASVGGTWQYGVLAGWMAGAASFVTWVWLTIWPMDPQETAAHAVRDDPARGATDVLVLVAAVASLGAVTLLLTGGSGGNKDLAAATSLVSVALAWGTVHTMFTTRYARLYYTDDAGGIDFNQDDPPQYSDFAYLAFTLGMTFQVSDTDIKSRDIRRTVLRHALLSYLFGVVIIAATINLVAGLGG